MTAFLAAPISTADVIGWSAAAVALIVLFRPERSRLGLAFLPPSLRSFFRAVATGIAASFRNRGVHVRKGAGFVKTRSQSNSDEPSEFATFWQGEPADYSARELPK